MEKLLDLRADERFDLVVLDTPPTRHALDFLEAPERMMGFLDTGILRWFLKPYFVAGRLTFKVATRTGALALRLADRCLGLQFLQDLSEFFLAFEGMYDGFKERAARVLRAAARPAVGVRAGGRPLAGGARRGALLPRAPAGERDAVRGASSSTASTRTPRAAPRAAGARRPRFSPRPARDGSSMSSATNRRSQRARRKTLARLAAERRAARWCAVPELDADVHDLRGLEALAARDVAPPRGSARRVHDEDHPLLGQGRRRQDQPCPPPPPCAPRVSATAPSSSPPTPPTAWPTRSAWRSAPTHERRAERSTRWRSTSTRSWRATGA